MKKKIIILSVLLFVLTVAGGIFLIQWPSMQFDQKAEEHKTKWQEDIKSKNPQLYESLTQAIASLEKTLQEKPTDLETLLELAATYQNFGDWKNAEKYYQKIIEIDENVFMLWNNLGRLYMEEGKLVQAKEAYLKLIKLFSKQPEGYLGLYNLYAEASKVPENKLISKEEILYQLQQGYILTQDAELKSAIDFLNKQ